MTPDQFRREALSLPEVVEAEHQGHPDFRAHGRVFATLHPDGAHGMVKVPPVVQQQLVRQHAAVFMPANGAWGRAGCTTVRLDAVDLQVLRAAMVEAWQFAAGAGKPTNVTTKKRGSPRPKSR